MTTKTVAALTASPSVHARAPFLVQGTVTGRHLEVAVNCPAEVLEVVAAWSLTDDHAVASWKLRDDHPEPLVVVARQTKGLIRETQRVAHVFEVQPGVALGASLTADCGQTLSLVDAEWLAAGSGMPCEGCLAQRFLPAITACAS